MWSKCRGRADLDYDGWGKPRKEGTAYACCACMIVNRCRETLRSTLGDREYMEIWYVGPIRFVIDLND